MTSVKFPAPVTMSGNGRPAEAHRLLGELEARQRHAEQGWLALLARSFDGYVESFDFAKTPCSPVAMRPKHMHLLDALDTLAIEYGWEKATPEGVAWVLRDRLSTDICPRGSEYLPWHWNPGNKTHVEWRDKIYQLSQQRWQVGQRVWPEALYRWYDLDERLLYVGISSDLATRQGKHGRASSWAQFAYVCTVERFPERRDVESAERRAIMNEGPLFNFQHNATVEARHRLVQYLVEMGRLDLLAPAVSRG